MKISQGMGTGGTAPALRGGAQDSTSALGSATEVEAPPPRGDSTPTKAARGVFRSSTYPSAAPLLPVGSTLHAGRFSVLRRIGEGSLGIAYEAYDAERKTRVAIKTLDRSDLISVYHVKSEFHALAGVTHPNLVSFHDLFVELDGWFLSMDLVDGVHFDEWVRRGTNRDEPVRDEARLREALLQLVEGVKAIHVAGKLHRDLKPSNALVTATGRVLVVDYGLMVDPELDAGNRERRMRGTPAYLAPEQAAGERATEASDYYAVGVMLYQALTGRLPFAGTTQGVLLNKQHRDAPAPSARVSGGSLPRDLEAACIQLLARDPAVRTQAFESLAGTSFRPPALRRGEGSLSRRSSFPDTVTESRRLYGRELELSELSAAYEAACGGEKPVVVLLSGESGLGKTALVNTFLQPLRAEGQTVVLSGRCFDRESAPFKGFDGLMEELSRHLRRLPAKQLAELVPPDAPALCTVFPVLSEVSGFSEARRRDPGDAPDQRRRAFAAFSELLARLSERRPVIFHLDDFQWTDSDSLALISHVLRKPNAPRLLLIASHRSEPMHAHPCLEAIYEAWPCDARLDVRSLQLRALSEQAVRELLRHQRTEIARPIAEAAAGDPFLLRELLHFALKNPTVPARELPQAARVPVRVEALSDAERRVLELLAVAARPMQLWVVAKAARALTLQRSLFERLRSDHLARASGDGANVECFHDRIREAVVLGLPADVVQAHHRALADGLFELPDADPEQVACHLLGAGDLPLAAEYFARAADRAGAELAFDRAARLYARALELGFPSGVDRHRLQVERAHALAHANRRVEASEAYLDACVNATTEEAVDLRRRAAGNLLCCGQIDRGVNLLRQALSSRGIRVPRSNAATIASVMFHETRLRLRIYRWQKTPHPDAVARRRFDDMLRAGVALLQTDTLRGIELLLRGGLFVLQSGDERDLGKALTSFLVASVALGKDQATLDRTIEETEPFASESHDVHTRIFWLYGRGVARLLGPRSDPEGALADFDRSLEIMAAKHVLPSDAFTRCSTHWLRICSQVSMGQFSAASQALEIGLEDAWNRADMSLVPMLAGRLSTLTAIALGDATLIERAGRELDRARAAWSAPGATLQEMELAHGEWLLHMHAGRLREALHCAEVWYRRLRRSALNHTGRFVPDVQLARGMIAAALAQRCASAAERDALLRHAGAVHRDSGLWMVRCALDCARGDRSAAIAALHAVEFERTQSGNPPGHWTPLHAYAARRRLGELQGDAAGRALVERADAYFGACGVSDPKHLVAVLLPGLEITPLSS